MSKKEENLLHPLERGFYAEKPSHETGILTQLLEEHIGETKRKGKGASNLNEQTRKTFPGSKGYNTLSDDEKPLARMALFAARGDKSIKAEFERRFAAAATVPNNIDILTAAMGKANLGPRTGKGSSRNTRKKESKKAKNNNTNILVGELLFPEGIARRFEVVNARIEEIFGSELGNEAERTKQAGGGRKTVKVVIDGHPKCRGAGAEDFCGWPVMHSEGRGNDCFVHSILTATCPAFRRLSKQHKLQTASAFRHRVFLNLEGLSAESMERILENRMLEDPEIIKLLEAFQTNLLTFRSPRRAGRGEVAADAKIQLYLYDPDPDAPVYMIANETDVHFESVRKPGAAGSYTISRAEANRMRDPDVAVACPFEVGDRVRYDGREFFVIQRLFENPPICDRLRIGGRAKWLTFSAKEERERDTSAAIEAATDHTVRVTSVERIGAAGGGRRRTRRARRA